MIKSKQVKSIACGLLLTTGWWLSGSAAAEVCTVEVDGYYQMGDGKEENQANAKEMSKVDAMRRASEQAAVFIESSSEVSLGSLTKDEVRLLSSAILEVEKYEYHPIVEGKDIIYRCHLIAKVDTDSVKGKIQNGRLELEDSLRKCQEENERLNKEKENMKKQCQTASEEQEQQLRVEEQKKNQEVLANQYFNQGNDLAAKKEYYGAIEAYSKVVALKPDFAAACYKMGNVYEKLGNKEKAMEWYQKAREIEPHNAAYRDAATEK